MTSIIPRTKIRGTALLLRLAVGLTVIAGCRDTTPPDSVSHLANGIVYDAGSALKDTLPFHIEQRFERVPLIRRHWIAAPVSRSRGAFGPHATAVAGGLTWTKISGGGDHTCAPTTSGAPYCWGRNDRAQLGDGTTTDHLTARAVAGKFLFMR